MKFEKLKISALIPAAYNPRKKLKPGDAEFEKIKNSITEFGYCEPVIVNSDMTIIGGHQRVEVLKTLGFCEIDCVIIDIDKTKEKALNVALNKISGEWDKEMLTDLIKDLQAAEFDVSFTGFDPPEIDELFNSIGSKDTKEDDCDIPLPENPVSQVGDLWLLGRHRLICGDSTDSAVFEKLLDGKQVNLVVTDPPYNINYEAKAGTLLNDNMSNERFYDFLLAAFRNMRAAMADDASIYVFHADTEGLNFRKAFADAELYLSGVCVWAKNSLVLGRSPYQWKHEPCQPAGTMVLTITGEKPIEDLQDGDRVVSYNSYSGQVVGHRNGGYAIKTAERHYDGLMYNIVVDGKSTRATDNHKFTIRYNPNTRNKFCTYLMRRGNWWRVGYTRTYNSRGFGLKERMRNEKADEVWLLRSYPNASSARADEQLFSAKFGIPQTYWEIPTGTKCVDPRSAADIEYIYDNLDKEILKSSAEALLSLCGMQMLMCDCEMEFE